jgi:hypothetical protein
MENLTDTNVLPRKQWVAPELKKIDIEAITQLTGAFMFDGLTGS